jgi:hypothetical protein
VQMSLAGGSFSISFLRSVSVHSSMEASRARWKARPPFHGVCLAERPGRARVRVPRPTALRPGLPPFLDAVCRRCLRRDPVRRYPKAEALAEALRRVLRGW